LKEQEKKNIVEEKAYVNDPTKFVNVNLRIVKESEKEKIKHVKPKISDYLTFSIDKQL